MEKIEQYQTYIKKILQEYGQYKPAFGAVEVQMMLDEERNHYQLHTVGWKEDQRIRGCMMHIDIINSKIWIQHDGTERGVANDLVEMGVPKQDIVLAFYAPNRRKLTDFAVE